MTTIAKVIRKAEKKHLRKQKKLNRVQLVNEHNLTFDHQKATERLAQPHFKIVDQLPWTPPTAVKATIEAPSLKQMFFLQENEALDLEPQQG